MTYYVAYPLLTASCKMATQPCACGYFGIPSGSAARRSRSRTIATGFPDLCSTGSTFTSRRPPSNTGTQQRRTCRIVGGHPRTRAASQETSAGTLHRKTKMPMLDVAQSAQDPLQTGLRGSGTPSSRHGRASSKRQGIRPHSQGRTHDCLSRRERRHSASACLRAVLIRNFRKEKKETCTITSNWR